MNSRNLTKQWTMAFIACVLLLASLAIAPLRYVAASEGGYVIGTGRVVPNTDPMQSSWLLTSHGVSEYVYQQDAEGNLYSRFIKTLEKVDSNTWQAELNEGVFFADGSEVDAEALAASMNEIQEKNELAQATAGRLIFTADDSYQMTIETERETNVMMSILGEWTNVVFKQAGDEYIYTGPYQVESLRPQEEIVLTPNTYYPEANQRQQVTLKAFQDETAMRLAFENDELDMIYPISPDLKEQLEAAGEVTKSIDAGYQYFMTVNMTQGPLADSALREALDLGLNREEYLQALKGGYEATGLFAHYFDFNGDIAKRFDPETAAKILDDAGWTLNEDGLREKDGETLALNLATLSFRKDLVLLSTVIASQLEGLGITCQVEALDNAEDLDATSGYDLLLYSQHTAPTGEPSFFLNQFYRTNGPKNQFGYSNPEVDQLLDELGAAKESAEVNQLAKDIQEIILAEDRPVLLVIDPQWHAAVSEELADYSIYCGDYYIVNDQLGLDTSGE